MPVTVKLVSNLRDLRKFINFSEKLYRGCRNYIPKLFFDQYDTLDKKRNPASVFCESALYLAYKDGKLAGRVAAIINYKANAQWNHDEVRFGWYDFIDDRKVSKALMDKVEEFGKERGMDSVVGPLGFTDFDPEGMLVEGFEFQSTMALSYNYPYYAEHMAAMGFDKDADWLELCLKIPTEIPERITRIAKAVSERSGVHKLELNRKVVTAPGFCKKVFALINECYKGLYNFTILPESMAEKYFGFYLSVLDLKYVSIMVNKEGEMVGFGITMPSLANALRRSRGKFFPFGWIPIVRDLFIKHDNGVEMLLIGVHPAYRDTGVNTLIFTDLCSTFIRNGLEWAETNAILEYNIKNLGQWQEFECIGQKRRRSFKKPL